MVLNNETNTRLLQDVLNVLTHSTRRAVKIGCGVTANATQPPLEVDIGSGDVYFAAVEVAVGAQSVALDTAHATLDRYDMIVVNNVGTASFIKGTAAADPQPPVVDMNTYVVLARVLITATTTVLIADDIKDMRVRFEILSSSADKLPLAGGIMSGAIDLDGNNVQDVGTLSFVAGGASITGILDEDNMASDSAVKGSTQQSIKKYVDDAVGDLGEVKMFALSMTGAVTKSALQTKGWAICDGTTPISQGISSPIIETTPNLEEKFIRMSNDESSGGTGGEDTHTLTISEMPAHDHTFTTRNSVSSQYDQHVQRGFTGANTETTSSAGGGTAHENKPPYYEMAFFMKVK